MGLYKYLNQMWQDKKEELEAIVKERLISWRRQPVIVACDGPSRLDKARMMGYKAKQGFKIVRVRLLSGGRRRRTISRGRKPSKRGHLRYSTTKSLQAIAEFRAAQKFPNMEVLNSYYVADDSKHQWYEIIMIDPHHPAIINDKNVGWIIAQRGRAFRGLTAAGRSSREARRKPKNAPVKRWQKERTRIIKKRG